MPRIIRILALITASLVLAIPWIWIFTLEVFAVAVIFDSGILAMLLLINDDRQENIREEAEKERKRNLPTTAVKQIPVNLETSTIRYAPTQDCAKCGLVITPMMVRKERGGLFYHLNCYPFSDPSPSLGV